ncbi:uncharacterized protein [Panulirus ornatus]|uniref:uncharacterized protein n=1 Tax=Panulirus ornatus TaxID=150431 RepID=UPI003A886A4F
MEVSPGQIALAVITGLILLAGLVWILWKVIKSGTSPCFLRRLRNDDLGRHLAEDNDPLLGDRAPRSSPATLRPGSQAGASPTTNSSFSSSSSSRTGPQSMTNYANFSGSNSSSEWAASSSSDAPYVYIPPIPESAKLSMSIPTPRNFPSRNNTNWTPSLLPVLDLTRDLVAVPVEDTDETTGATAAPEDIDSLMEAINSLPSRLAKVRTNYYVDDLRNHITRT